MTPTSFAYQAYYCEENIWQLAQRPPANTTHTHTLLISNPTRSCALWLQRAAPAKDQVVIWDYHVILIGKGKGEGTEEASWWVWDLDTWLGCPVPALTYLSLTFSGHDQWPALYKPMFRLLPAADYVEVLSTDRSHMLDQEGHYLRPPPPWPAPYQSSKGNNLMHLIDMQEPTPGLVLTLEELHQWLASQPK